MVQVVSMLHVPIIFVSTEFQSKDVIGAQNSECVFYNGTHVCLTKRQMSVIPSRGSSCDRFDEQ